MWVVIIRVAGCATAPHALSPATLLLLLWNASLKRAQHVLSVKGFRKPSNQSINATDGSRIPPPTAQQKENTRIIKDTDRGGVIVSYNDQSRGLSYNIYTKPRRHCWSNSELLSSSVQITYGLWSVAKKAGINTSTPQWSDDSRVPPPTTSNETHTRTINNTEVQKWRRQCVCNDRKSSVWLKHMH